MPDLPEQRPFVVYDFEEADAALYTAEFFARLEAVDAWAYRNAFLPVLARDPDVPRDVLLRVTRGLSDYIHSSLGWALLRTKPSSPTKSCSHSSRTYLSSKTGTTLMPPCANERRSSWRRLTVGESKPPSHADRPFTGPFAAPLSSTWSAMVVQP